MTYRTISALTLAVLFLYGCDSNPDSTSNETSKSAAPPSTQPTESPAPIFATVNDERLVAAANEPGQWLTHGGTYEEHRYSR